MIQNPQPGARVRVIPARWHSVGDCLGTVEGNTNGNITVLLDGAKGSAVFAPDDLDPATVEATPAPASSPDGYEETLVVVKALRVFADEAKRRRPARAEAIEAAVVAAQGAMWRVYGLDEPRSVVRGGAPRDTGRRERETDDAIDGDDQRERPARARGV